MSPKVQMLPDSIKVTTIAAHVRGAQVLAACNTRTVNPLAPIHFTFTEASKVCDDVKMARSILISFRDMLS